ncbi:MAG: S-layer homology domain-containing protein [Firmicutes bacterium]|nr:S-layer homology domain-containing protein [Bacillota bacterium]
MLKKRTRFIAFLLALSIAAPSVVWADTQQEIDVSALRVSEAFAAKHPNGMFEVLSPYVMTSEGKEFDFYVLRRGGTEGEASVSIKAVEISAKYGEDFVLQEKDALGFYHDLKKNEDNPTILENQIEQNKDILFTTDRLASGAGIDVYAFDEDETVSGAAVDIDTDGTSLNEVSENEPAAQETVSIDEALQAQEDAPVTAYSDDMGSYTSALHKMRDEATGVTTPTVSDSATYTLDDVFEVKNKEEVQLANDAAEAFDGLAYTVDFKDGEAYKVIHVKITDDDVYEAQETFSLSLYDPTNGAEIGEQNSSSVIIDDDEKVEKSDIGFALENYQVFSDADGVTVTLKREGNVNDYVNVYVSTLADTAKADEDYTPVMGDIMFLPGETEKKIYVPILKDNIAEKDLAESLYFDITAETDDNADITGKRTRVEILPFTNTDNKGLVNVTVNSGSGENGKVTAYSEEDAPVVAYADSGDYYTFVGRNWGRMTAKATNFWGCSAWSYYNGSLDLVGIERITFKWQNNGISASSYNSRQVSTVKFGNVTKSKYKTFDETNGEISASDMQNGGLRKDNVSYEFKAYCEVGNAMNLWVYDVFLHYTKFNFLTSAPDKMTYNVYNGTGSGNVVSSGQFSPGTTTVSADSFRKYNYIKAYANLGDEGRQYGCTAKDVTVTGNGKSLTKNSGESIYVDSAFIKDYIYNGDTAKSTLKAKANFARTEKVNSVYIESHPNGIVKIGGTEYDSGYIYSDVWMKGDKLRIEVIPNQGYHVERITADGKIYKQGDDISLSDDMTLCVEFAKDDNSVTVIHDFVGTNALEPLEDNYKHGYVTSTNLTKSDVEGSLIQPLSKEQFVNNLSSDEKNKALLPAYQQYVEDNGLVYVFTNEIPQLYLDLNGYNVSNKNFDYKSKLKLSDYKALITYFRGNFDANRAAEMGRSQATAVIKYKLKSGYKNQLKEYFGYKSGGTFGNDVIYYNDQKISKYMYSNLINSFVDTMLRDRFAHLTEEQKVFLGGIITGKTQMDLTSMTDMIVYALSENLLTGSSNSVDEYALLDAYCDESYNAYLEEIEAKNADIRAEFVSKYAINNLTTGDTVNLFAQVEDGYTCAWRYTDSTKTITESDMPLYTIHVGDSFSFEVKDSSAKVEYYFVKVNEILPDSILHGRVIRPTQTLRTKGSERVNLNDKSTYQAVQGMDITIGSLDPSLSGEINGKTYYPTTQTDAHGYFDVLVPHGTKGLMTNLIMANGDRTYVKHAVVLGDDTNIIFALPYQDDNIWVRSFEFDCEETKTEGIYVVDKNITLTAKLDVADGYGVSKVILRSYNVKGELVKAWQMDPQGDYVYKSTFNAKEYLKDGGRMTIEAYNAYGLGVGQVESGCLFTEPPQPAPVGMPAMDELGGASFDTVGSVTPELDSGDYVMTPEKVEYDESTGTITTTKNDEYSEPFEIAVLSGNIIKNEIKAATEDGSSVFINGTALERVDRLTAAIDPLSSNIIMSNPKATGQSGESTWKKPDGMGKVGAKGGKLAHSVGLDVGFYIRLYKKHTADGDVKYYYDQIYALFGVNVDAQKDFQIFVGPVPCYITIKGGITVKGLLGMSPKPGVDTSLSMDGIKLDADVLRENGMDVAGLIIIKPRLTLGAGVGVRGAFSVGVSGNMYMDIAYQPWTDGAGTVLFALKVDIDVGFIPISFAIAQVKLGMFYTENYHENSWLDFSDVSNKTDFDNYIKTMSADDETTVSGSMGRVARGHGNTFETPIRAFAAEENDSPIKAFAEEDLRGTLKHPKPQLLHLGDKKQILFYLGDDPSRDDYDCQAVYYVLYDGSNWGQPQLVDNDGTADMDFNAVQADNKVILVYSDLNKQFGNSTPDMPEYLGSADMSICVFDENGDRIAETQLTKEDGFANMMPRIAYDEKTARTFIAYLATDYNDSRADFDYSTMGELNSFLNNSYGTVCYKMLDKDFNEVGYSQNEVTYLAYEEHYGDGSLDNQRFVPLAVDTLNVNEMTANTYNDKVYITYTVDTDGNSETSEDMELYASVIDINNNSSVGPIRLTTNDVQDSNPQTVEYDGKIFIYWNRNGNIVYSDLDSTLGGGDIVQTNNGYTAGDMFWNEVQQGAEAAQTFRVSYEPNGILYLTWNQLDSNIKIVNEEEVPTAKRSIYMRAYDPHYSSVSYTDEETGETKLVYSGMWGAATEFDVPDNNNEMFNEQTFTALDADTAMCAFRRFNWIEDGKGVKEAPNSDLVIHRYHVVSTLEITDVYSDPQYPTPGDDAVLHVKVENVGVLPSESVTFKAKLTDSEGNVTDLGEDVVYTHLATSGEVEGSFTYQVPENGDSYTFSITAYEENYTENAGKYEKTFAKAPVIENIDPQLTRTNNAYENIKAAFVNKGNKATGEMTLKVSARNNGENAQLDELLNTTIASLEPNETVSIDDDILIGESWGSGNMIRLYISLENADGKLYNEIADLYLLSDEDLDVTDIVINDGNEETIEVNAGEWATPHFEITPIGATASNKLVYSISDSEIADIDPSNGRVYGKKEGTATITVSAVNSKYSLFVDEDNSTFDSEGNLILFDENGVVNEPALAEAGSSNAVLTKQVQVKVTGTLPETTTEITTEATTESTTETASEVTTKSSSGRSSGGGGGSSSRIAAATTTTEETSEITTTDVENNTEATTENTADDYTGFIDVKGLWCENIVNTLHDLGLVNGRTEELFAPNDNLTRAELVQLLANLSGADLSVYANADAKFADVETNAWYYAAVMWAADNNIVYGIGNDMFAPDTSITREDTAAIIYRYLGVDAAAENSSFADTNEISAYASAAVNTLSAEGIINGYPDNTFRPKNTITRAEAASVLYGVNER